MASPKQTLVACFMIASLALFMVGSDLGFAKVERVDEFSIGGEDTVIETDYLTVKGIKTVDSESDPTVTEWVPWGTIKDIIDADDGTDIPEELRSGLAKMYWTSILAYGLPILLTASIFSFNSAPSRLTLNVLRTITLVVLGLVLLLGYLGTSDLKTPFEDDGGEFSWAAGGFLFAGAAALLVCATVIAYLPSKEKASAPAATRPVRCPRCTKFTDVPVGAQPRCGNCGLGR